VLAQVKASKEELDAVAAKVDKTDNTVGLVVKGKGKLVRELDRISLDIDKLISDIKKSGLKLNVDIF
jgi:phospholipid/cholesterol/gamma-HCH transport system substrate-binding protein